MDSFARLKAFRQTVYENLCRARDATFELTDAIMLTREAYCLADLSQCPVFRRKWSSVYVREACPFGTQHCKIRDLNVKS